MSFELHPCSGSAGSVYEVERPPPMSTVSIWRPVTRSTSETKSMQICGTILTDITQPRLLACAHIYLTLAALTKRSMGRPWLPTWMWTPVNQEYFLYTSRTLKRSSFFFKYFEFTQPWGSHLGQLFDFRLRKWERLFSP